MLLNCLLSLASVIVRTAIESIGDSDDLGELLTDICISILRKTVKMTKTDMDDKLLESIIKAMETKDTETDSCPEDIILVEK